MGFDQGFCGAPPRHERASDSESTLVLPPRDGSAALAFPPTMRAMSEVEPHDAPANVTGHPTSPTRRIGWAWAGAWVRSMAVFLLWWALVGALFLAAVRSASSQQPTDCPGFCVSDAGGLALMGIFVVWPVMLVSPLVAAIVLAARSRETRSPACWAHVQQPASLLGRY